MSIDYKVDVVGAFFTKASVLLSAILVLFVYGCGGATQESKGRASTGSIGSTQGGETDSTQGGEIGSTQSGATSNIAGKEAQASTQKSKTSVVVPSGTALGKQLPPRRPISGNAKEAYQRGVAASRSGNDAAAKSAFEEALNQDNRSYQAAYNLGVLADRKGKENDAIQYYRRALIFQPDCELAVQGLVNIQLRHGSIKQAITIAEPLAQKYQQNLYLQAIYANVLIQGGALDQAEQVVRNALRQDERFVPAMIALIKSSRERGRDELADSILTQALAIDGKNAELYFIKGKMAQKDEHLADAMKSFEQAVQLRPDYAEARIALGIQYLAAGNYQQALDQFLITAKLAPELVAVHLNLGDAYRAMKQWADAKKEFDTALHMKPDLPEAHFNLALLYMSAGANFPGLDTLSAANKAINEFNNYRQLMGSKLKRDDISQSYITDLQRSIQREQQRIEREKAKADREKERDARPATSDKEAGKK
jgi:tetratricopeptide (TPR) repeat protein